METKFHGQRSLVGYSPRGHMESDITERVHMKTESRLIFTRDCKEVGKLRNDYFMGMGLPFGMLKRFCN